jgi:hypothetical protein
MLIFISVKYVLSFIPLDIGAMSMVNFRKVSLISTSVAVTSLNIRAFLLPLMVF